MQPAVAAPAPPKQLLLRPGSSFARDPSDHLLRAETPRAGADATDARRSNAPASRGDVGFVGAADDDVAAAAIALYVPPTASAASSPSPPIHDRESGSHVTTLSLPSPVAPHRDNLQCPQDLSGISLLLTAENLSQTFAASASLPHLLQKQELDGNSTSHRKRVPLPQLPAQQYQLRQHRQTPLDGYFRDDDDFVNELSPVKKKRAQQQKSPDPSALPASAKEKSYPCLYPGCGKVFPRAYNLKSHYYCHSGERPHACGTCGACFSRKHDLQRHVRTV
ncbi:hypothetical protein HDU83_005029 [Entophlyctis luteolus]|nr:hypothetical protein HDU83_005029 [Entophlyctis luteolus]